MGRLPENATSELGRFIFPKWTNSLRVGLVAFIVGVPAYVALVFAYGASPQTTDVGYQPLQPLPYSHAMHAGKLGMDCRYCHNTVERADFAAIPPTETCMNCHRGIWPKSEKLEAIRTSFATGMPVTKQGETPGWKQVTTVPDYVYFNHSAHVNSGVSCVECHGQVNQMDVVYQAKPMNMAWCLQCHRDPTDRIRPRDQVANLDWKPSADDKSTVDAFASLPDKELTERYNKLRPQTAETKSTLKTKQEMAKEYVSLLTQTESIGAVKRELGAILKEQYHANPNTDCITCHR
jgi:menaquinone reductase, multiheme cytochrome c subunit